MKLFIQIGFDENDNPETANVQITVNGETHTLNSEYGAIVIDAPADAVTIAPNAQ